MVKNVIIGILVVLSFFFFFYGLTQKMKAENCKNQMIKTEREALEQKEMLEAAVQRAQAKTQLVMKELEGYKK